MSSRPAEFKTSLGYVVRSCSKQNKIQLGTQWLTPVILATQEAEIRRIAVRGQPRQIVRETLSQKYLTQKGLMERLKV
jgi:hypothetical protein